MKAGWEVKALGEVASLEGRIGWKGLTAKEYTDTGPLFLSVHSLNYGDYVDFRDAYHITQERYDESPEIMLQEGDVLICKDGAGIGKVGIMPKPIAETTINSSLLMIRATKMVLAKYLYYCLLSPYFQSIVQSKLEGATTPHLYQREINQFPVFLAPLDEQKRIVEVLDAAFEGLSRARAHTETNLQNARELFERVSSGLLAAKSEGWAEKTLSQVCEKITDGTHQTPTYFEDGVIFLSSRNVTSRKIDWQNVKYIDQAQHIAMHKRVAPRKGDILLAKNGTTGVAAIVDRDEAFDIYVSLAHLRPLEILEPEFLLYFLNSGVAKAQFNSRLKGQGVPNLHLQEIREVRISFPNSRAEQLRIVEEIKELDAQAEALQAHYRAKLADLDALRQALLQKAFAGELT